MGNTMQTIQEKVKELYGSQNSLASVEFLRDVADALNCRTEFRNENQTIEQLFEFAINRIEKRKGKDKIKTVVSHEKGYFIDELRDGTYEVCWAEKTLKYCPTLNEAVNYMIVKLN